MKIQSNLTKIPVSFLLCSVDWYGQKGMNWLKITGTKYLTILTTINLFGNNYDYLKN